MDHKSFSIRMSPVPCVKVFSILEDLAGFVVAGEVGVVADVLQNFVCIEGEGGLIQESAPLVV